METVKTKFLAALHTMQPCGGVLVALSGGADSVCLLDLFLWAKANGDFPYPIAAAHINHNLRGEESDRDEAFCRTLCEKNGIPLFVKGVDVNTVATQSGKSIEEAARDVRYAFFEEVLQKDSSLCHIATAHHTGDFCETMLLNLIRGSGITGLCSIPRMRGNILRPLLDCSREEILAYNEAKDLAFVTDSTNLSAAYSRNRLRLHVLPEFAKISAGYAESMQRTAALLARDADYLNSEAKKAYTAVVEDGALDTKKAQNFHPSILTRILRMLYNEHGTKSLAEVHVDAIASQIQSGKESFTLSMPDCVCIAERGMLTFAKNVPHAEDFCIPIEIGKEAVLPSGITVLLSREPASDAIPIREDALRGKLTLRTRREGDTIKQFGKTHKIKRMIADKKLSAAEKSTLFFLTADEKILYANLPAVADNAFCKPGDGHCIFIITKETL